MNLKQNKPIIEVFTISVLAYLVHKLIFWFNNSNPNFQNFYFSLESIYGFFLICALLIVLILIKVKSKSIDNVGFAFIWTTMIQIAFCYVVLSFITNSGNSNLRIEKLNFFIIFALFLTIETIVTIRILSNKQ